MLGDTVVIGDSGATVLTPSKKKIRSVSIFLKVSVRSVRLLLFNFNQARQKTFRDYIENDTHVHLNPAVFC